MCTKAHRARHQVSPSLRRAYAARFNVRLLLSLAFCVAFGFLRITDPVTYFILALLILASYILLQAAQHDIDKLEDSQ